MPRQNFRNNDPESSKIAGKKVKPTQAMRVLEALKKYGVCIISATNAVNLKAKITKMELNE